MSQTPLLEMRGISKAFAGVPALSGVDFCVNPGEVMGLAGQNGAGKSTLIKILTGVYQRDSGRVLFGGTEINPHSPREAQAAGISTIYQELNLVPNLCVAENISLGREIYKKGILDWNATYERAETVLSSLGISVNVRETVSEQSVAIQQMIAIARAVSFDAKLIVMDEPTSSLEDSEVKILLGLIKNLKARGISVVFVTHRLDEMFKVCDRITVLRDGKLEGDYAIGELDKLSLILKMIGKSKEEFSFISTRSLVTHEDEKAEDVLLELKNVKLDNRLLDVSFIMVPWSRPKRKNYA